MSLQIDIQFSMQSLTFDEMRDFQTRIKDLNKLKELLPLSGDADFRKIRIYYPVGSLVPVYEITEFDTNHKLLGKTRYFSPEDLR